MKSETYNSRDKRFRERFKTVIERLGTLERAGSLVGTTGEQVGKWRDERAKAPFLAIAILAQAADVSPLWLAFGEGYRPTEYSFSEGPQPPLQGGEPPSDGFVPSTVMIPMLDVKAAAGPGSWNERASIIAHMPFPDLFFRRLGVDPQKVHGITADGDSMLPTIEDGKLVLVDTGRTELGGDRIWSLVFDDQVRIKRVQKQFDGSLMLISDNRDLYPPERIDRADAERVEIVGRVFWTEKVL